MVEDLNETLQDYEEDINNEDLEDEISEGSEDGAAPSNCSAGNVCLNMWEVIFNVVSILTYLLDVGSDISLAVRYYLGAHWWWFGLTIGFVFLPSLMMTGCNIIWYIDVKRKMTLAQRKVAAENKSITWVVRATSILFQCGPVLRSVMASAAIVKKWRSKSKSARRHYERDAEREEVDSSILRLFECFLEAIPQLCLQLYITASRPPQDDQDILTNTLVTMRYISMLTSLLSALWALCAYHRRLLRYHNHTTCCATIIMVLWHFLILTSRIIAISISATFFHEWIFLLISCHWLLMLLWVLFFNDTKPCDATFKEFYFDLISSWAYIFYFFNLERGRSPWRYLVYYSLVYLENAAMIIGWYHFMTGSGVWYQTHAIVYVFAGFFTGVVCQAVYHAYFHHNDNAVDLMRENFKGHGLTPDQGKKLNVRLREIGSRLKEQRLNEEIVPESSI